MTGDSITGSGMRDAPDPEVFLREGAGQPLTSEDRAALLDHLCARFPAASITAIEDSGLFVDLPAEVPLAQPRVTGHVTALELVEPTDIVNVIEAWKSATSFGFGLARVRPLGEPDGELAMYFIDTRDEYGVLLGMFVTADGSALPTSRGADDALRPRLTVVRKTRLAEFLDVDDAFEVLLGYQREQVLGLSNLDLVHPDEHERAIANWVDLLGRIGSARQVRLRHRHADGHWVWFELTNHNRLDDPAENCVVTEMIDISDEMAAQESLRASQQLLARLTDALPVGVVQLDRFRHAVYANPRAVRIMGHNDAQTMSQLFADVAADDLPELDRAFTAVLDAGMDVDLEVSVHNPSGRTLRCRLNARPLTDDGGVTGAIVCIEDVTEPARLRTQLEVRATYDALTGCLNRAAVLAELEQALDDARMHDTGTAVVFVDLDGFKSVNDSEGHTAGDALLQEIARHLCASARRGDVLGRVGGDEFLVIGRDVDSPDHAMRIAQRLADGLADNVAPRPGHRAAASIGVAWAPGSAASRTLADQLIVCADNAMYTSKREGEGRPVLG